MMQYFLYTIRAILILFSEIKTCSEEDDKTDEQIEEEEEQEGKTPESRVQKRIAVKSRILLRSAILDKRNTNFP